MTETLELQYLVTIKQHKNSFMYGTATRVQFIRGRVPDQAKKKQPCIPSSQVNINIDDAEGQHHARTKVWLATADTACCVDALVVESTFNSGCSVQHT